MRIRFFSLQSRSLESLRFAVRFGAIFHYLGLLLIPLGFASLVPAAVAGGSGRPDVALAHLGVAGALLALAFAGARLGRRVELQRNEALVLSALVFPIASLGGAIPLTLYGLTPLDAWFEASSGATTTGLSILESTTQAPFGLLFARAWLQWIGGLGVLALALALVVTPGASARRMGFGPREMADLAGSTRGHARRVLVLYLALTAIAVLGLLLLGASGSDASLHALAAVSTGGFAPHDDSLASLPGRVQGFVLAICFAGAVPASCYYLTLYRRPRGLLGDPRIRHLALVTAVAVAALVGIHLATAQAPPRRLGALVLTAVSAQTTAGFSSLPISELSAAEKLVVIGSMFVGGGVGSTAGGIKVFRLMVCLRIVRLLLDRISVVRSGRVRLRVGRDPVSPGEIEGVVSIVSVYALVIALSWLAFLVHGYDALDALFEVVSAVGTVGLSSGITGAELPAVLKGLLSVDMLLGRLEIIAFLVLFRPSTWLGRRRRF